MGFDPTSAVPVVAENVQEKTIRPGQTEDLRPRFDPSAAIPTEIIYPNVALDSQRKLWEKQGPIGPAEAWKRAPKTTIKTSEFSIIGEKKVLSIPSGMIPFNMQGLGTAIDLMSRVKRLDADVYKDPKQKTRDIETLKAFMLKSEEERVRGFSKLGHTSNILMNLPGFVGEFIATRGAGVAVKGAAVKKITKILGKLAINKVSKTGIRAIGWGTQGYVQATLTPHRIGENYLNRRVGANVQLSQEGIEILEEAREKPFTSFFKAYADQVIEMMSETAGAEISRVGGKIVGRVFPQKMGNAILKTYKKLKPNAAIEDLFTKAGYNGVLEEFGEERLGDIMRAVVGVEDFGDEGTTIFDRLVAAAPDGNQVIGELIAFSVPGTAQAVAGTTANVIKQKREVANLKKTVKAKLKEVGLNKQEISESMESLDQMLTPPELPSEEAPEEVIEPKPEEEVISIPLFKNTPEAFAFGIKHKGNKQVAQDLREAREKAIAESNPLVEKMKRGEELTDEEDTLMTNKIFEAQLYREALEKMGETVIQEKLEDVEKIPIKEITTVESLQEKLKTLESEESERAFLKRIIRTGKKEGLPAETIAAAESQLEKISLGVKRIKETTILKNKIKDIQRGIREGKIATKQEIKTVQDSVIKLFKEADLEIPVSIKNIQTQEQLNKALPGIRQTIERLEMAASKREASASIKKELKTTKPLKVGQRRVGKFDFETNKLFDAIREFNKLNQEQAQAEFDKFPEEALSEFDLIKKRFLSLKANGASASLEIHTKVLEDILKVKELGKQAKSDADLEKAINRQAIVDSALASIGRIKADKEKIKTKIGNIYRRGFSNIYSMLNSVGGKQFAETYDPELNENRKNAAIYKKTLDVTKEASAIYSEPNIMRMFETMSRFDYRITDLDGLTTELSKLELIDIYNSIKNDKKKADYYEAFSKAQITELMNKLTVEDKAFGDMLQESVQEYREVLNLRNIEITGRDLGFIENYWPATSEFQVSVYDDIRVQGETPSAAKERAKTRVIPVPRNAWYKAQKHISQAEHIQNLSREFETLRRLFTDRKVKHVVTQKFGEDVYNTILAQIDNISLNKQTERIDAISGIFQKAINNWVTAKIALNPSTFVRQLMSVGNYAEKMDSIEWTTGFFKGIATPVKTFNFMWNNAPFLEARFNKGYSEALKEAIKGAESISVNKKNWTKFLTSLVRAGDVSAIIYGGFPLVKAELAKGKSMQEAIDTFEKATLKAQQSGLSSSVSQFQNSKNPFTRLFLAFKNTSNQYFRKMVDAVISFQNGDISISQFAKSMTIYAVIQPILYVSAGFATKQAFSLLGRIFRLRDDEEEVDEAVEKFLNDVMIQLIVSPVNAMPIIDDVSRTAARKLTGQKVYKVFSTPLFDDLETGIRALTKKEITGSDYLKTSSSILEPLTGAPIGTGIRYFEILTGTKIGEKPKKRR